MLITTKEEITRFLPTNVLNSASMLMGFLEEAERSFVAPVLGTALYERLTEEYESIPPKDLDPSNGTPQTPWMKLIKRVQLPITYRALAEATDIINVSVNAGGGMNVVSTGDYAIASKDRVDKFRESATNKSHQGIDSLLCFLEEDARSREPVFLELWKESDWYYMNSHYLFRTAIQFDRFVNINKNRERFILLLPDVKFCEETFLRPEIGDELMDALIAKNIAGELTKMQSVGYNKLCTALALYVENRNLQLRRPESLNEAELSLAKAKEYIAFRQDAFLPEIVSSPLYTPPPSAAADASEQTAYWENNKRGDQIFVMPGILRN